MSASPTSRRAAPGFTLLEVLVAFTIMAVALVALLQAFTTGLDGTAAAEARTRLLARAENRLAAVGATIPLAPGVYSGNADGFDWRVDVRPYPAADDAGRPRGLTPRPMRVEVVVTAPGGARQRLVTLRLASPR